MLLYALLAPVHGLTTAIVHVPWNPWILPWRPTLNLPFGPMEIRDSKPVAYITSSKASHMELQTLGQPSIGPHRSAHFFRLMRDNAGRSEEQLLLPLHKALPREVGSASSRYELMQPLCLPPPNSQPSWRSHAHSLPVTICRSGTLQGCTVAQSLCIVGVALSKVTMHWSQFSIGRA